MLDENTLSPEDLSLLVGLAGPIYAESRRIESYSSDNPVNNGMMNDGSMKIKMGLEQMQRQVVAQAPKPPMQQMYQPQVEQAYLPPPTIVQYVQPPQEIAPSVPVDQFEFNFNISEQKKTNDLLEVISKKLTKMIGMLESKKKSDDLIKLIPKL